jgi:hypothetical protein
VGLETEKVVCSSGDGQTTRGRRKKRRGEWGAWGGGGGHRVRWSVPLLCLTVPHCASLCLTHGASTAPRPHVRKTRQPRSTRDTPNSSGLTHGQPPPSPYILIPSPPTSLAGLCTAALGGDWVTTFPPLPTPCRQHRLVNPTTHLHHSLFHPINSSPRRPSSSWQLRQGASSVSS